MIIEELADHLETEGVGTVGDDIFIGELPLDVGNCMALLYSVSSEPNKSLDVYEQTIDFWVRNKSASAGYALLKSAQEIFHRMGNYELDSYHVYFSNSLGSIEDNDRDTERRKLYKLAIRFIYRPFVLAS